jgi:hypothetical protein
MTLFNRLLKLKSDNNICRLEDFFTEIVAHFLEVNRNALKSWLKFGGIIEDKNCTNASLATQKSYQLAHENGEKRPDIVVELSDGANTSIIFFESKIASTEGPNQLNDYAKVLNSLAGYQHKYLVYITRNFDPKESSIVLQDIPNNEVKFIQLRWHQFYQFLSTHPESALIREIQLFMQEHRMAQSNQFSAVDIVALTHFPASLKLMEQSMWGETLQKFEAVLGHHKSLHFRQRRALQNIQWHGRYIMSAPMPDRWACFLGFQLKFIDSVEHPYDYPVVHLNLEIDPKSPHRQTTLKEFKSICEKEDWRGYGLGEIDAWSGVTMNKSLRDFLVESDHVAAIENFFLKGLESLDKIRKEYAHLPWGIAPDDDEESDSETE